MAIASEIKCFREFLGFKKASDDWQWKQYIALYKGRQCRWMASMPHNNRLYTLRSDDPLLNRSLQVLAELAKPLLIGQPVCTKRTLKLGGRYFQYDSFDDKKLVEERLKLVEPTFSFEEDMPMNAECNYLERCRLLTQGVVIRDWSTI